MSDDHEYTTDYHGILSTWPGDWRARALTAETERNNREQALREVNTRLVEVAGERDALRGLVEESIEHASWLEAYAGQLPFDVGFVASVRDYITRAKGAIQPKRKDDHR